MERPNGFILDNVVHLQRMKFLLSYNVIDMNLPNQLHTDLVLVHISTIPL